MRLIPHEFRHASNSVLMNCSPLSETSSSGYPNLAKIAVSALITSREVVSLRIHASG